VSAERYRYRLARREVGWLTGLVTTGPFDGAHARVTAQWEELAARHREIGLEGEPDEWLAPSHGRETEFTYYIGLPHAAPLAAVPDGMVAIELRPHEYAVASFAGSQDELLQVYADMVGWIVRKGRELYTLLLWLESYLRPYRRGERHLELEIWLPLIDGPKPGAAASER
jgi:predicted transcriptional regulator YdeE